MDHFPISYLAPIRKAELQKSEIKKDDPKSSRVVLRPFVDTSTEVRLFGVRSEPEKNALIKSNSKAWALLLYC